MADSKTRIEKWDNLKFILIFLVVLGHICDMYTKRTETVSSLIYFIYIFHMPLFLFVSGLFSKKNIDNKRYHNIILYFVLYIIIKFVCSISNAIFYQRFNFSLLSEGGIPWYAFALFAFSLITIALRSFPRRYIMIASIMLACFVGYDNSISDFLVMSRIIVFYPFFFMGYCVDSNKVNDILSKRQIKIISAIMLILLAVFIVMFIDKIGIFSVLMTGRNPFSKLGDYAKYGAALRLIYYFVVFLVGAMVISVTPEKTYKGLMAKWGSRSVQVFVLHKFFMDLFYAGFGANSIMAKICPSHPKLLIFPLTILIVAICSLKIWEPLFDRVLKPKEK